MKACKGVKSKAEAPSLSSWTLCLQAELISGGWHPLIPEQVGEDLERSDAVGQSIFVRKKADEKNRHAVKQEVNRRKMTMMLIISATMRYLVHSSSSKASGVSHRDGPS